MKYRVNIKNLTAAFFGALQAFDTVGGSSVHTDLLYGTGAEAVTRPWVWGKHPESHKAFCLCRVATV